MQHGHTGSSGWDPKARQVAGRIQQGALHQGTHSSWAGAGAPLKPGQNKPVPVCSDIDTAQEWQLPWLLAQSLTGRQRSLWKYKLMPELLATAFKILAKRMLFYMLGDTHLTEGRGTKRTRKNERISIIFYLQETVKVIILRLFSSPGLYHLKKTVSKSI